MLGTVVACATMGVTAPVALATSSYTAVVTPTSAPAGATTTFNVALTNETASNGINFAMITPPQSFTLTAASAPQGATIQLLPTRVIVRGLSVPLGATVNIFVTATVPAPGGGSGMWTTQAFSTGPSSAGVFLDTGASSMTTSVTTPQTTTSPCPATGCSVSLSTPSTSFRLDVFPGTTGGPVTASVDTGTPVDGPGGLNDPGCASYTPQSPDWYQFNVSDTTQSKTVNWTVNNSDPRTFRVCFGATYEFYVDAAGDLAPRGTLPDGTPGFVGLLPTFPNCFNPVAILQIVGGLSQSQAAVQIANLCASISPDEANPTTTDVTYTIPSGFVGDPMMGR
jgi:hypothetical protein